jgi:ribosomal protein L21E
MSQDWNAGQDVSVKIDNSYIERMEEFKYLGTLLTDQNSIQEENKSRLKLGVRKCLLSFGAKYFVFQVTIQKLKDQ